MTSTFEQNGSLPNLDEQIVFDQASAKRTMDQISEQITRNAMMEPKDQEAFVGAVAVQMPLIFEAKPGSGKTLLAKTAAKAVGGDFKRIQGTADLTPTDITGIRRYNPGDGSWEFEPGPIFANFVLVDEINRMSGRAQSGLIESMQEGQVTEGGKTYELPKPFMLIATANLQDGTYDIPMANLDRFGMAIRMKAHGEDEMIRASQFAEGHQTGQLGVEKVVGETTALSALERYISNRTISHQLQSRAARIVTGLRSLEVVQASQSALDHARPSIAIRRLARALAVMRDRTLVEAEHIDDAARYVLPFRTQLTYDAIDSGKYSPEIAVEEAISRAR